MIVSTRSEERSMHLQSNIRYIHSSFAPIEHSDSVPSTSCIGTAVADDPFSSLRFRLNSFVQASPSTSGSIRESLALTAKSH